MPYARIPPDKLDQLPLFGIEFLREDGNMLWFQGPGEMVQVISRLNPRVWFEDAGEAHQAGAMGILIASAKDREAIEKMKQEEAGKDQPDSEVGG